MPAYNNACAGTWIYNKIYVPVFVLSVFQLQKTHDNDAAFDVSGFNFVKKQITVNTTFETEQSILVSDIAELAEIPTENAYINMYDTYAAYENGYVEGNVSLTRTGSPLKATMRTQRS